MSAADRWAVVGLLAATVAVQAPLLAGGVALGMDAATQFVPWYAWLGAQLRAGHVPGWNPQVFSGMPFAGAALSGWGYLPAMLLFALLPVPQATAAHLLVTLALAGVGAYTLARALGMPVAGALVAGAALEFSGYVFFANMCCFAFAQVEAWLPWTLLGVRLATRASRWPARLRGWAVSAVALSQVLAAWFGQGAMYVLLALSAWLVWETVVCPAAGPTPRAETEPHVKRAASRRHRLIQAIRDGATAGLRPGGSGWRARVSRLALHAGAVLGLGALLAAAGMLPRLELNLVSNLAGGYPVQAGGQAALLGGWRAGDFARLAQPGVWYAGVVPLALAAAAPLVARRRDATGFFTLLAAAAGVLALARRTPLHTLLLALPLAGRLHPNAPERVLLLAYPAIALLAGATVSAVLDKVQPRRVSARWIGVLAVALVAGDLLLGLRAGVAALRVAPRSERLVDVDLHAHLEPGPVASWLRAAGAGAGTAGAGGRYFGYAPQIAGGLARPWAYSVRWADPRIAALLVNNAALAAGLEDIQGYDAVHIARYDDLIRALNGVKQDYHFADIRPAGVFSPLLDVLNVRWVLVPSDPDPADAAGDPARTAELTARLPTVYDDGAVRVLERPTALGRAWLVHDARRETPGRTLALLASGAVDPSKTALLEVDPPPLRTQAGPTHDRTRVAVHEPDRIVVETASDAGALLVLSEVAYPAWHATVDGRPAEMLVADHALRAVPVPVGVHTVELRFASPALTGGTAVSALTALALAVALASRHPRRPLSA